MVGQLPRRESSPVFVWPSLYAGHQSRCLASVHLGPLRRSLATHQMVAPRGILAATVRENIASQPQPVAHSVTGLQVSPLRPLESPTQPSRLPLHFLRRRLLRRLHPRLPPVRSPPSASPPTSTESRLTLYWI